MKLLVAGAVIACSAVALADAPPPPTVKLVTPGKGPLRPLRFAPKKGAKRTLVVTTKEAKSRGVVGQLPPPEPLPAVRTVVDVEVTDTATGSQVWSIQRLPHGYLVGTPSGIEIRDIAVAADGRVAVGGHYIGASGTHGLIEVIPP